MTSIKALFEKFLGKRPAGSGLVGLSVSDSEIALAHVVHENGMPSLKACEVFGFDSGEEKAKALEDRVSALGLADTRCCYVLGPSDYNLVLIDAPNVAEHEMAQAVKWRIKDLIDRPIEDVVIDVFPIPEEAYKQKNKMVYVVAARRDKVAEAVDLVDRSGLRLDVIDIPELALLNLSSVYADDGSGLAFMDLRSGGSTMNLCKNGTIYLTRRLNTQVDPDVMQSEQWQSVRERLVLEVQRSLDYYESQMGQIPMPKLLLAPRGEDSEALAGQLDEAMTVKVENMDLAEKLHPDRELPLPLQQSSLLAIGGALRQEQTAT